MTDIEKGYIPALRFNFLISFYDRIVAFFVQILDGFDTTCDNVKGKLPKFIEQSGF